jgi:acyl phosphate:glycerol-3-phosphate acyltransferase
MLEVLLLAPFAYMLGTFPSAILVARARGVDITREGSGNPGASNVARLLGYRAGLLVLALDIGKGALAAGVGAIVDPAFDGHRGAYVLGLAAVLGHVFPVTRKFKGGRGVATGAGALAVVFPLVVAVCAVVWLVIARGFHKASVASVVSSFLFVIIVVARGASWLDTLVVSTMAGIVIIRHGNSMLRVIRGQEHSLSYDPTADAADDPTPQQGTAVEGDG